MTKHNAARAHSRATDPDRWTSVPHAARQLGISRQTVYAWIAQGKLQGDHVAGRLVIRNESISAFAVKTSSSPES